MNNNNTKPKLESFVPYIIINADEQITQEIFNLTDLITKHPNDGDLGKTIREKFLKIKE